MDVDDVDKPEKDGGSNSSNILTSSTNNNHNSEVNSEKDKCIEVTPEKPLLNGNFDAIPQVEDVS